MNVCADCGATHFISAKAEEVSLEPGGGEAVDVPSGIEEVIYCDACGTIHPSMEAKIPVPAFAAGQKGFRVKLRIRVKTKKPKVVIGTPRIVIKPPRITIGGGDDNALDDARRYVVAEIGDKCGFGKLYFLKNNHPSRAIKLIYNEKNHRHTDPGRNVGPLVLQPGQKHECGCTQFTINDDFRFTIVSAAWA